MNTKTIKRITWKTWQPVTPADFPCLICRHEPKREAIYHVSIGYYNFVANFVACEECAKLSAGELLAKMGL
jgi:hypothetical protein